MPSGATSAARLDGAPTYSASHFRAPSVAAQLLTGICSERKSRSIDLVRRPFREQGRRFSLSPDQLKGFPAPIPLESRLSPAAYRRNWAAMPFILVLLILFYLCGGSMPSWGAVPLILGVTMLISGLLGIIGSARAPGATAGLGSVFIAFFGVVVCVLGLGMDGRGDIVDACLGSLRDVDGTKLFVGSLIVGIVLAAFARRGD